MSVCGEGHLGATAAVKAGKKPSMSSGRTFLQAISLNSITLLWCGTADAVRRAVAFWRSAMDAPWPPSLDLLVAIQPVQPVHQASQPAMLTADTQPAASQPASQTDQGRAQSSELRALPAGQTPFERHKRTHTHPMLLDLAQL